MAFGFGVFVSGLVLGVGGAAAQVCEPAPNGYGCTPLLCSDIPEEQCLATVVQLDPATGAITAAACACMNFNYCHVEFGDASPRPVGWCPDGSACDVHGWDVDNDGVLDHFSADCMGAGACCVRDAAGSLACIETTELACLEQGGTHVGIGTTCPSDPEELCAPLFSACCFDDGRCYDVPVDYCIASGGMPVPGVSCDQVDCGVPPMGACCLDIDDGPIAFDTCLDLEEPQCAAEGGLFHPDNAACLEVQACCFPDTGTLFCQDMNPHCCLDSGGSPQGPGSTCENTGCGEVCGGFLGITCTNPDDFCKYPEGTCHWADHLGLCTPVPEACPDIWDPVCGCDGVTYSNECEADRAQVSLDHHGACNTIVCRPSDDGHGCTPLACSMIPEEQCLVMAIGKDPLTGALTTTDCQCLDFNLCHIEWVFGGPVQPVGHCPNGGTCEIVGHDLDGDGVPDQHTAECVQTGACCFDMGGSPLPLPQCVQTSQEACESGGGFFHGLGSNCDGVSACCLPFISADGEGYCVDTSPLCCADFGGVPLGPGWTCADVTCGPICGGFTGIQCEDPATFCKYPEGTCGWADHIGFCVAIPEGCPDVWDPVCGCDGVTYGNECEADMAQVSIAHHGACERVCFKDDPSGVPPCGPEEYCQFPEATCGAHQTPGVCTPFPQTCPFLWDPVCGCDGVTYSNDCVAASVGVSLVHRGECDWACCDPAAVPVCPHGEAVCCATGYWACPDATGTYPCEDGPGVICEPACGGPIEIPCDLDNRFCKFPVGTCGEFDDFGMCTPIPDNGCPEYYDPVCGCDGVTYGNECEADAAAVSIRHWGPCERHCGFPGHPPCFEGEFCKFPVGSCGEDPAVPGLCTEMPGGCPDVWDPVCGCDGNTYGNECEADAAGVSIRYLGECQPDYCFSNTDCANDQYCFFEECAAETGVCQPRPEVCPDIWDPVCGCDGVTYANACEAARAGMSVDHPGACEGTYCWSNADCANGQYCFFHVCAVETGVCQPIPQDCPDVWDPVCGCDGVTYPNACEAARAGMSVDYPGECERVCTRLGPEPPCHPDEFCKFPPGTCEDLTVPGICAVIPEDCPAIWAPVCGCDGVTYSNECFADAAAMSIDYFGACEGPPCVAERNLSDPEPTYCPGVPKHVQIHLNPVPGASSYALEDTPPAGWIVSEISNDGVYDEVNHKVKWGPFFASTLPRSVSYVVVSPDLTAVVVCFSGTVSVDGINQPICGDACMEAECCPFMQADLPQPECLPCPFGDCMTCTNAACRDGRITLCELIGYACAWLHGCNDDLAGVTRAAYIWLHGECYCWDDANVNWYPVRCPAPSSGCCPDPGTTADALTSSKSRAVPTAGAVATAGLVPIQEGRKPSVRELQIPINIEPPSGTSAVALEFGIPEGWDVVSMSGDGTWDEANRKVKWGPYFDDQALTLTLDVRRAPDTSGVRLRSLKGRATTSGFAGTVSFDGQNVEITVR
jgi:hypothetical protein